MQSNFAQQWSTALGLNVSAVVADQAGVQHLSQGMANFLQTKNANSVLDKINLELNALHHFGEGLRLNLDYGDGMVVNDDTKRLADAFLVEAGEAIKGTWPQAWGDDLKEPLMIFVAYATANNAIYKKQHIDWAPTLSLLTKTYTNEKGVEKLREQMNSIDQLMPQVLTGVAQALLPLEALNQLSEKIAQFAAKQAPGAKPQPVEFLDLLLEVRSSHLAAGTPAQMQP